ncbi:MAG: MGMT family protein [Kiritimatiellia bacterium]|nr:MGMT family protein [Kiritimatiellia bacterium]
MNPKHLAGARLTNFQRRVYETLLKIPRGKVTTYKILARYLSATGRLAWAKHSGVARSASGGQCRSYRAVGQALRRNPFAPEVPCHRVIASDLSPGGFSGQKTGAAIKQKLKLLKTEGVTFQRGRLADPARIWFPGMRRKKRLFF